MKDWLEEIFGPPTKVETFDIGDAVICDWGGPECDIEAEGGYTFGSKAVCPACVVKLEQSFNKYPEERRYIGERANPGESFRQFVLRLRGGKPGGVTITTYGP